MKGFAVSAMAATAFAFELFPGATGHSLRQESTDSVQRTGDEKAVGSVPAMTLAGRRLQQSQDMDDALDNGTVSVPLVSIIQKGFPLRRQLCK